MAKPPQSDDDGTDLHRLARILNEIEADADPPEPDVQAPAEKPEPREPDRVTYDVEPGRGGR